MAANSYDPSEHLREHQFKPGQSGNPSGRPRKPVSERLLQRLIEEDEAVGKLIAESLLMKAISGDVPALRELLDRTEGKVADKQEHTGADGGPIQAEITVKFV